MSTTAAAASLLSCPICQALFRHPVTTPCGHSFCQECLQRALSQSNHAASCPLCRRPVHGLGKISVVLSDLVESLEAELDGCGGSGDFKDVLRSSSTPKLDCLSPRLGVFVLSGVLLVPGRTVMLNVFEPRYLTLMRRCLASGDAFGMQASPDSSRGCTLKIRACHERGRALLIEGVVDERYATNSNLVVDEEGVYIANDVVRIEDVDVDSVDDSLVDRTYAAMSAVLSKLSNPERRAFQERCAPGFGDSVPPSDPSKLAWFVLSTVDCFSGSRQDLVYETELNTRLEACLKALEDRKFGSDPKARLELFARGLHHNANSLASQALSVGRIAAVGLAIYLYYSRTASYD